MRNISLAAFVIETRESKGINSARELARKAGLSHTPVIHIESGKTLNPTIETLIAIARALNVPVMNLVLAAQGKDPEAVKSDSESYHQAFKELYEKTPKEALARVIKTMPDDEAAELLLAVMPDREKFKSLLREKL